MSSKRLSPGANLLRNSRLVAMPPPVPPPLSHNINFPPASPYPTMQAIATPTSSMSRGDWGLKRDLPLKTKSIYLRYKDLDTLEHMTTFTSAHDDVFTVKKWQEMDIPISRDSTISDAVVVDSSYGYPESVFDGSEPGKTETYKWRYTGPYLVDLTPAEMRRYIASKVKPRKAEFLEFAAKQLGLIREQTEAIDTGIDSWGDIIKEPAATTKQEENKKKEEEEEEEGGGAEGEKEEIPTVAVIAALRADPLLQEKLVLNFLDIPISARPHITHPSAGLHYIRTFAHLRNDPKKGPQQNNKPVPGRVLNNLVGTGLIIGIGGIAAKCLDVGSYKMALSTRDDRRPVRDFSPKTATINSRGRIMLQVEPVEDEEDIFRRRPYEGLSAGAPGLYGDSGIGGDRSDRLKGMIPGNSRFTGGFGGSAPAQRNDRGGYGAGGGERKQSTDQLLRLLVDHDSDESRRK